MLLIIIGVRPQFIKALHFINELQFQKEYNLLAKVYVIDTGQHYDQCFRYEAEQLNKILGERFKKVCLNGTYEFDLAKTLIQDIIVKNSKPKPKCLIVFGDADPALIGAHIAQSNDIKLVHIEAGGRRKTSEKEHQNSVTIDSIADYAFCVTEEQLSNLDKESFCGKALLTGDIAYNAMQRTLQVAERNNRFDKLKKTKLGYLKHSSDERFIIISLHRPYNIKKKIIQTICKAVDDTEIKKFFITHPRNQLQLSQLNDHNCILLEPLSHSDTLTLLKRSAVLITDSGGLIREANHVGTKVIAIDTTGGWPNIFDKEKIIQNKDIKELKEQLKFLLKRTKHYSPTNELVYDYGIKKVIDILNKIAS